MYIYIYVYTYYTLIWNLLIKLYSFTLFWSCSSTFSDWGWHNGGGAQLIEVVDSFHNSRVATALIWVFPQIGCLPQIIHFNRVWNHYKPSILGEHPLFLETPILELCWIYTTVPGLILRTGYRSYVSNILCSKLKYTYQLLPSDLLIPQMEVT